MTALDMQTVIDLSLMRAGDAAAANRVWAMFWQGWIADVFSAPDEYAALVERVTMPLFPTYQAAYRKAWELLRDLIEADHRGDPRAPLLDTELNTYLDVMPTMPNKTFIGVLMDYYGDHRSPFQLSAEDWQLIGAATPHEATP